jgi:hypothetical protein
MIFGILAAVSGAGAGISVAFGLPVVTLSLIKVTGGCFLVSMLAVLVSMIFSPQLIIKLAVIPVVYALVMIAYMLYHLHVLEIFTVMLGGQARSGDAIMMSTVSLGKLSMMLHVGVWICSIPLIIAGIFKFVKLSKHRRIDFSRYDDGQGIIKNVVDTKMRMNKVRSYQITLAVESYQGESYEVTKDFLVPMHVLHTLTLGKQVALKINPKKREDVFIQSEYGVL